MQPLGNVEVKRKCLIAQPYDWAAQILYFHFSMVIVARSCTTKRKSRLANVLWGCESVSSALMMTNVAPRITELNV